MRETTIGQLLLDRALPEAMRGRPRVLDKKGVGALFQEVAEKYPSEYRDVAKKLSDVGREAAYRTGGMSFGPEDLVPARATVLSRAKIRAAVDKIYADNTLDPASKRRAIITVVRDAKEPLTEAIYREAAAAGNPLTRQISSGMRGNKTNLASLIGFDGLYEDQHGNPIAVPILSAYSEGLRPHEFLAGSFGARKGVIDTKLSTQRSGFFSKQLHQVAHRLVVTRDTSSPDEPGEFPRGLPVEVSDPDNEGALLAHPAGGYPRNTLLSRRVLAKLKAAGVGNILVRSPTVGGPPEGGVDARDIGMRERDGLSPRGDFVGISAGQSIGEKLTQGQLCLEEKTEVRMADWSIKLIRDIVPGDVVLGADKSGQTFPVRVVRVFDNGLKQVRRTTFEPNASKRVIHLDSTADHKILTVTVRWSIVASACRVVHHVIPVGSDIVDFSSVLARLVDTYEDDYSGRRVGVEELGTRPTRDIEVDHPDHLFVLANGLVVGNSSKHAGGVAGASKATSGFAYINNLVQAPKIFPGGATHAIKDGVVGGIAPAPQGGTYVTLGGEKHYVATGAAVKVAVGDHVDAGDVLSEGAPNPAEIVKHKGIGEGRRYFTQAFKEAYNDAGMHANRRNIELIARGLIDHVAVLEPFGDHLPGDTVHYSELEQVWKPRDGAKRVRVNVANGQYLEAPVLHHTIGTKLTKSIGEQLKEFGIAEVLVHREPPPFEPRMVRALGNLEKDSDWMTRHLGANITRGILDATHHGALSDPAGTSYVPGVADRANFGRRGLTRAWRSGEIKPIDRDSDGYVFDGTPREQRVEDDEEEEDDG